MSVVDQISGGKDTTRLAITDARLRAGRDRACAVNLAAFALEHDDPEGWLAEMLSAFGLDGRTSAPPSRIAPSALAVPSSTSKNPSAISMHGTLSRYINGRCRCEECTQAQRTDDIERASRPDDQIPHGTHGGYKTYGCRCDRCREALYEYRRQLAARPDDKIPHGTASGYRTCGCRCDRCRQANTATTAEYRRSRAAERGGR